MKIRSLTEIAEVIDEDDFVEETFWSPVQDTVYRTQERRPSLIVEAYDHARLQDLLGEWFIFTSEREITMEIDIIHAKGIEPEIWVSE